MLAVFGRTVRHSGVQPEAEARAAAGDECAEAGDGGGDRQADDQGGAGVPGVQQPQGGHGGERNADAERDDHRQPQRFVEQDVGVDGGVVHPVRTAARTRSLAELPCGDAGLVTGSFGGDVDGVAGSDDDGDDDADQRPGDGFADAAAEERERRAGTACEQDEDDEYGDTDGVQGAAARYQVGGGAGQVVTAVAPS